MYAAELIFKRKAKSDTEQCIEALWMLLPSLRNNGQILNEYFFAQSGRSFRTYAQLPEVTSLDHRHDNKYVARNYAKLAEVGLTEPIIKVVGETTTGKTCRCDKPSYYILFTTYLMVSSPVQCGDCFLHVPLYRLPKTYDESEYYDLLLWNADYQSCDSLQMSCATGERFGTREISDLKSSLSKRGRELCQKLEQLTGKPFYYYLYRTNKGRSRAAEHKRPCPNCNQSWLLPESLYGLFDFRCEPCRLLSNIAWNIRHS